MFKQTFNRVQECKKFSRGSQEPRGSEFLSPGASPCHMAVIITRVWIGLDSEN